MSTIFGKLQLNLKKEWIDYLTFKGWKIRYYKNLSLWLSGLNNFCSFFSKVMNYICDIYMYLMRMARFFLVVLAYFLISSVICAKYEKQFFGFDVWKSEILIDSINSFNMELANLIAFFLYSLTLTSFLLLMVGFLFALIAISIIKSLFPVIDMRVDTSDIPLSFMGNAFEELEVFDFTDSPLQKQKRKDQITQLISFALIYFIKVDNGNKEPDYTNFCYILWSGHLSEAVQNDILFRANGLYKKIDELCIKINNMNNEEEKNAIVHELKMYLKVIKNRDLSNIDPVPYKIKKSSLTTLLIKASIFLQKII